MAVVLAIVGPELMALVYGEEFRDSAGPLRLLLPGLVAWTCGNIASGALGGLGRPGRTSIAQGVGVVVTVVGLVLTLPRYGIDGAALTSTLSYLTVTGLNLYFLRAVDGTSLRRVLSPRRAADDGRALVDRVRSR